MSHDPTLTAALTAPWVNDSLRMWDDGKVTYYVDSSLGNYREFIDGVFTQLEADLNVDFEKVYTAAEGEIDFYGVKNISTGTIVGGGGGGKGRKLDPITGNTTLGYANNNGDNWELFIKQSKITNDAYDPYVIVHELGHALGLEHPFEGSDGDSVVDPGGETTVMSYDLVTGTTYFTDEDIHTLQTIWA